MDANPANPPMEVTKRMGRMIEQQQLHHPHHPHHLHHYIIRKIMMSHNNPNQ